MKVAEKPVPVVEKVGDKFICRKCGFEPNAHPDAMLHARWDHGADPAYDEFGNIWDAREPAVLRQGGLI